MPNFKLDVAMSTHPGFVRTHNEDAVGFHYPTDFDLLSTKGALFVLADGVGGLPGGEKASHYVVNRLIELYYDTPAEATVEEILLGCLEQVNSEVYHDFEENLATTVVAVVIRENEVITVYAGDSRGYRYDASLVRQYTDDHVVQILDEHKQKKTRLTRAVGYMSSIQFTVVSDTLSTGQGILLLTDGATVYFNEDDLLRLMSESPRNIVTDIIRYSLNGGGHDNISAIMIVADEVLSDTNALRQHVQQLTNRGISIYVADNPQSEAIATPHHRVRWRLFLVIIILLISVILSLLIVVNETNKASFVSITQFSVVASPGATQVEATDEIPDNLLLAGRTVIFEAVVLTYRDVNSATSAFLIVPDRQYQIISTQIDDNDRIWYQLYDEDTESSGWIVETELPAYTTSD